MEKRRINGNQLARGGSPRYLSRYGKRQLSARRTAVMLIDWHQHLGFLLDDVAYHYARRFKKHARGLSLTLHQCKALAVLANCEGINQRFLSESSNIDFKTLVRILDRLEADGWVERNPDPHDRRAHLLTTTESAKPVVQHIWHAVSKSNAEALKDFAIRDLPVLTALLARVHTNLAALEPLQSGLERGE